MRGGRVVLVALAAAMVAAAGGVLGSYAVYQPRLASVEGASAQQAERISQLQGQLTARESRVEELLEGLGKVRSERAALGTRLEVAETALKETTFALDEATASLAGAKAALEERSIALAAALQDATSLGQEVAELESAQVTIRNALKLQSEILVVVNDRVNPLVADAALLAQQGARALARETFPVAVAYFEESGRVFLEAQAAASSAAAKSQSLSMMVPQTVRLPYSKTHRQMEAAALAAGARGRGYKAAAGIYQVVDQWLTAGQQTSAGDLKAWKASVGDADALLEEAMDLLDEADEWAPDLWRQSEALRLEVRQWQQLLESVRAVILGQ